MTKKPETVNRENMIKRKDGLYYKKYARVPFTGTANKFHKNSQLMLRGNFIKGLAEGLWERYHDNGQLISTGYMCEWSEREERINEYLWSEDILIPNVEIISHRKPVATSEGTKDGFIHLLYKYPIFPKRNKDEIELSKEALVRCQNFINYMGFSDIYEMLGRSMKMPKFLGVIKKHKDIYKYEYKDDLLDLGILNDLFENNDSLYQDSIYQYEGWIDDSHWGYKDEGIEFKWHYPWFIHISDEGLKNCAQEVWGDFLSNYSAYF